MKKNVFLFFIIVILTIKLWAIPACPELVTLEQPDGTKIEYFVQGDEKVHWCESPMGYTLLYNADKYLVFAEKDQDGELQPSNLVYRGDNISNYNKEEQNKISQITKKLYFSDAQVAILKQLWNIPEIMRSKEANRAAPVVGERHVLVILAQFSDKFFVKTKTEFEALMNQDNYTLGGNRGSVRDFYRTNSYGQLDFHVTVVGPITLPNVCAYYAPDEMWKTFAKAVAIAADPFVDFSTFAENGYVPSFHIIFAGYGDEAIANGQQIWSHKSQFYPYLQADGVFIGDCYSCSPELMSNSGSNLTKIGVIAHELCHTFGAPDYYDIDKSNNGLFIGTGNWDLMANGSWNNGGACPANINMWQKIVFGWVNAIELTEPATIMNMPNSNDSAVAYWIKVRSNGERYVLENRQRTGFDAQVPGHGLLIYHIHNNAVLGSNFNNNLHPQKVYPVCRTATNAIPDATPSSYGSINSTGCPYPGTGASSKTVFSDTSTPQMFYWSATSGVAVPEKAITDITEMSSKISFNFRGGSAIDNNIKEDVEEYMTLFPNPVNDFLQISNIQSQISEINIFDLNGKKVFVTHSSFFLPINVSQLLPGIYILQLTSDKGIISQKFIKI
ncbi:MAG: M6 family metalloprotease domain-containing protein [Bacteroidales bacterium]|jgi:M6 family metalloprotease-like protein|nr:M6 family metalloprotease domain-containing protein [Bacteroidales bacterium]